MPSSIHRTFIRYGTLVILSLYLTACKIDWQSISCDNCFEIKPTEGLLSVKVSHDLQNPSVPIQVSIKTGNAYEELFTDTLQAADTSFWVPVEARYSVTAYYYRDGKTIEVVDGDRVDLIYNESGCQNPCWRPQDGEVNCTLVIKTPESDPHPENRAGNH